MNTTTTTYKIVKSYTGEILKNYPEFTDLDEAYEFIMFEICDFHCKNHYVTSDPWPEEVEA